MPSKYTKKGNNGGRRNPPGGRPAGESAALRYGEVKALASCKLRVPEGATPEQEQLAAFGLERVIAVAAGKVSQFQATAVLKAATRLRDEACGPIVQKHEVQATVTTLEQLVGSIPEAEVPAAPEQAPTDEPLGPTE